MELKVKYSSTSYHKRDILYKHFQAEFPKEKIISLLIPLSAVIIEVGNCETHHSEFVETTQ